jgi:hypothetical protein
VAFLLNTGSAQEAASLLLSSLGGGADGGAGSGVRLTRTEAARVLTLRSDLTLAVELRDLFEGLEEEDGHAP